MTIDHPFIYNTSTKWRQAKNKMRKAERWILQILSRKPREILIDLKKKETKNKIIKQSKHFRRYSNRHFYILLSEWSPAEVVSNEVNFDFCGETFLSVRIHFITAFCLSQCFIIQFVYVFTAQRTH